MFRTGQNQKACCRRVTRSRRRGAAMIEFALCLPILLILFFGIIEIGRALMVHQILTNGAREGARLAIIPGSTDAQVTAAINTYMANAGINGHSQTVSPAIAGANSGDAITILVTVPYNQVSWGAAGVIDGIAALVGGGGPNMNGLTLTSTVIMRKE